MYSGQKAVTELQDLDSRRMGEEGWVVGLPNADGSVGRLCMRERETDVCRVFVTSCTPPVHHRATQHWTVDQISDQILGLPGPWPLGPQGTAEPIEEEFANLPSYMPSANYVHAYMTMITSDHVPGDFVIAR